MTFTNVVDIAISDISHVTKQYIYLYVLCYTCKVIYVHLHIAKCRKRYDPGKIVIHGCELYV